MKSRSSMRSGERTTARRSLRGGVVLGIFVGLILGLAIAAAVAYYLGKSGLSSPLPGAGAARDVPARGGKADTAAVTAAPDKPRFDFYKILPGGEEPKLSVERKGPDKAIERLNDKAAPETIAKAAPASTAKAADRLWLQAGAFASESDAESMKARLALAGWEAVVQSATLPDQGVRYRVRLGPYDNTDEVNRVKTDLGKSGFDAAVIKNP
ncbi:MAG: SPOR domain-containing protein [Casimicrobiaceae bacterium]